MTTLPQSPGRPLPLTLAIPPLLPEEHSIQSSHMLRNQHTATRFISGAQPEQTQVYASRMPPIQLPSDFLLNGNGDITFRGTRGSRYIAHIAQSETGITAQWQSESVPGVFQAQLQQWIDSENAVIRQRQALIQQQRFFVTPEMIRQELNFFRGLISQSNRASNAQDIISEIYLRDGRCILYGKQHLLETPAYQMRITAALRRLGCNDVQFEKGNTFNTASATLPEYKAYDVVPFPTVEGTPVHDIPENIIFIRSNSQYTLSQPNMAGSAYQRNLFDMFKGKQNEIQRPFPYAGTHYFALRQEDLDDFLATLGTKERDAIEIVTLPDGAKVYGLQMEEVEAYIGERFREPVLPSVHPFSEEFVLAPYEVEDDDGGFFGMDLGDDGWGDDYGDENGGEIDGDEEGRETGDKSAREINREEDAFGAEEGGIENTLDSGHTNDDPQDEKKYAFTDTVQVLVREN